MVKRLLNTAQRPTGKPNVSNIFPLLQTSFLAGWRKDEFGHTIHTVLLLMKADSILSQAPKKIKKKI